MTQGFGDTRPVATRHRVGRWLLITGALLACPPLTSTAANEAVEPAAAVGAAPSVPDGWVIEAAPVLDGEGLAGTVRYRSPSDRLLVYVRQVSPGAVDAPPARWLERYNRSRHFDEHGTRAYTLEPVEEASVETGRLLTQTVLVESERHWPFAIDTLAWFQPDGSVRWAALVDLHDDDTSPIADRAAAERDAARSLVLSP